MSKQHELSALRIFEEALGVDPESRNALIDERCGDDRELRAEVELLLRRHSEVGTFLDSTGPVEQLRREIGQLGETPRRLAVGGTLGNFTIEEQLGAGGMGEVYRAHDGRLDRLVAIKVLPARIARDASFRKRFLREARAISQLTHPRICTLYDVGEGNGVDFLVMELLEGTTLSVELARGPLPVSRAIETAVEIAEGLEYAHERGIVHRDLKPGNLMRTATGVKLLDFGLAYGIGDAGDPRARSHGLRSSSHDPTTAEGIVLGTFAYMSPQQARGESIDKQTDIWAFGCVLYELLTGQAPFAGETPSDVVARVIEREPDWNALPKNLPRAARSLLLRCLQKNLRRRLHDIADARIELEEVIANGCADPEVGEVQSGGSARHWVALGLVAAACTVIAIGLTLFTVPRPEPPAPRIETRTSILLPEGEMLAFSRYAPLSVARPSVAISPDGKDVVFAAVRDEVARLFLRPTNTFEVKMLEGTEGGFSPFFSPDSSRIAFFTPQGLHTLALRGGRPELLCAAPDSAGGSWGSDETIVFSVDLGGHLMTIPSRGGIPHRIEITNRPGGPTPMTFPKHLPGSRDVLFASRRGTMGLASLDTGRTRIFSAIRGTSPQYVATGHILYARNADLYAVPFDLERGEPCGAETPIVPHVRCGAFGAAHYAVSERGMLVFVEGVTMDRGHLVWRGVGADAADVEIIPGVDRFGEMRLSPDGRRLAVVVANPVTQIVLIDLESGQRQQIKSGGESWAPVWSPDGSALYYGGKRSSVVGVFRYDLGADTRESLVLETAYWPNPRSVSPDNVLLVDASFGTGAKSGIFAFDLATTDMTTFVEEAWGGTFSPDGNWVAYTSIEAQGSEVCVEAYGGDQKGRRRRVSTGAGSEEPLWSPDGSKIVYRQSDDWYSVDFDEDTGVTFDQKPVYLFTGPYRNSPGLSYAYDGHDGHDRFALIRAIVRDSAELRVVTDLFAEIQRAAPPIEH